MGQRRAAPRLAILSAGALVCLALFILRGSQGSGSASGRSDEPAAPSVETPAGRAATLAAPESVGSSESRSVVDVVLPEVGPSTVAVEGTIVVLDEHGVPHASESGRLLVRPAPSEDELFVDSARLELPVVEGRWDAASLPPRGCRVVSVSLGGRSAIFEGDRTPLLEPGKPKELRARWVADTVLHVVDADSGAELDSVIMLSMAEMWSADVSIPSERRDTLPCTPSSLASPITLRAKYLLDHGGQGVRFFARTPRHAWRGIVVDRAAGGDLFLKLEPGGCLAVQWSGGTPAADHSLRLRRLGADGSPPLVDRPLAGGVREATDPVVGLPVGEYEARLESGPVDAGKVLASAPFTIRAGETSTVALVIPEAPPDRFASVVVVVRMDESWDLERLNVYVTDLGLPKNTPDATRRVAGRNFRRRAPGVLASKPIRLRVARHQFFVEEARLGIHAAVTATEPQEVTLTLPPSCRLAVTAVDASTGLVLHRPYVTFEFLGNDTSGGHGSIADPSKGSAATVLQAPAGRLSVTVQACSTDDFLPESLTVDAPPGELDLTVPLKRARRFTITLREGGRPVDCTTAMFELQISDANGKVIPRGVSLGSGVLTCSLEKAGLYHVAIPTPRGYETLPDQDVNLSTEESVELVLTLVREQ